MHSEKAVGETHSASWFAVQWIETIRRLTIGVRSLRHELAECLHGSQLSETEFLLLWSCYRAGHKGVAQIELAARTGTSKAQTSVLVEALRQKALLESHRPRHDRRRQFWQLTSAGHETVERVVHEIAGQVDEFSKSFLVHEQHRLMQLLELATTLPWTNRPTAERAECRDNSLREAA